MIKGKYSKGSRDGCVRFKKVQQQLESSNPLMYELLHSQDYSIDGMRDRLHFINHTTCH